MMVQGQAVSTGAINLVLQAPGPQITRDTINRIWAEVVKTYPYSSLQFEPSGTGAAFLGTGPEDVTLIKPPIVQVRDIVELGVAQSASKITSILKTVAHHVSGPTGPLNLGIKIVYHVPAPAGSAVDFILSEMIKGGDDVQALAGAMRSEASVTFLLSTPEVQYTLAIEPLRADPTYVYVDLDAQYPGAVDLTAVEGKIKSVDEFMRNQVNNFLDKRAEAWGR